MRLSRFLKIIWKDIGISCKELLAIIICGIILSLMVLGIGFGLGWILSWLTNQPFGLESIGPALGLMIFVFMIFCIIDYFYI